MTQIRQVLAREVLDSRGDPTVEVEIALSGDLLASAIVPAGASTGAAEAHELRDGDAARYDGRGVRKAVDHVERILGPALVGLDPLDQGTIDQLLCELDGTPNKSRLGANAILGVSLAVAHAAATARRVPLYHHLAELWDLYVEDLTDVDRGPQMPLPMTNMISGGLHAGGNLDFQDFLIAPAGAASYPEGLEWIVRVYRRLGRLLHAAGYEGRLVGDEGGYGPRLSGQREALELLVRAIEAAGLRPGRDVVITLDVASTHFYRDGRYRLAAAGQRELSSDELIDELAQLVADFPIVAIEDGLAEDDWEGWERLTARLGERVALVGDDLFATNSERLAQGVARAAGNAVLIKVNQIGTLTETMQTMRLAAEHGYQRVVSARSGETEDTTIADLAVGTAAAWIKIGSITRSERLAKYNRLLRIAEALELAPG